jgi:glycosyltransferase involved in cell wall biosynthesis
MIHFFPRYTNDASADPIAVELRRLGIPHRFFATQISQRYRAKSTLFLVVYPRLAWVAMRDAVRSMVLSQPKPSVVIVGTDVEALVFGVVRSLTFSQTRVVMQTLIITPRRHWVLNKLYHAYFSVILGLIDGAICHSRAEVATYPRQFRSPRCRFAFVPYGMTVSPSVIRQVEARSDSRAGDVVTAGRSNRDYRTLAAAIEGLDCRLRIICDLNDPVADLPASGQITVLSDCFDLDYFTELAAAKFVVVPLSSDSQSAGQMVLLQASALGKAMIVTRSQTTVDYGTDGLDVIFVEIGDVGGMRAAIKRLLQDDALRERLGANARERFHREYSSEVYARNVVAALKAMDLYA